MSIGWSEGLQAGRFSDTSVDGSPASPAEQALAAVAAKVDDAALACWKALVQGLASRQEDFDAGEGVESAATPSFMVEDVTIALRFDAEAYAVDFYADCCGPEDIAAAPRLLHRALELSGSEAHGGVRLGLHPDSGRLVAFLSFPVFVLDAESAMVRECFTHLVGMAHALRPGLS